MNPTNIGNFYKDVGHRVREARLNHIPPFSQEALGKLIDMSRTSIVNIEQGKHHIQLYTLFLIAQKLQIDLNSLIPQYTSDRSLEIKTSQKLSTKEKESVEKIIFSVEKKKVKINE